MKPIDIRALLTAKNNPAPAAHGHWQPHTGDGTSRYGIAALQREADTVANATAGTRNDTLNRAAFCLAQLIASGHLASDLVHATLTNAAQHAGLPADEITATLRSGWQAGVKNPRSVPPWEEPPPNIHEITPPLRLITDTTEDGREGAPQAPPDGDGARERSTWWPRDLEAAITGADPETPPTVLHRTDGQPLFYPGKVNGLLGPSESGKTWIALLAVAQQLDAGHPVTYLDFEDTEAGIVTRLRALGVTDTQMRTRLAYINPDDALTVLASADLAEHLQGHTPATIVLDGVNAAMTLLGYDLMSNQDATAFAQRLLRPLSATGAAVVYIDHTPKNAQEGAAGGIGAQAKRAMTTGCALRVEVVEAFGKGQDGRLRLHVDKDRPGVVRGASAPGKQGHWAGDVTLRSAGERLLVDVHPPGSQDRPVLAMRRISDFLVDAGVPLSGNRIEKGVTGDNNTIRKALDRLVVDGHVARVAGTRGGFMYSLTTEFDNDSVTTIPAGQTPNPTSLNLAATSLSEVAQDATTSLGDRVGASKARRPPQRGHERDSQTKPQDTAAAAKSPHLNPTTGLLINTTTGEATDWPANQPPGPDGGPAPRDAHPIKESPTER